jgi:hypothetical protein
MIFTPCGDFPRRGYMVSRYSQQSQINEKTAAKQKLKTHEKAEGTRHSRQSKDKKTKK